MDSNRGLLVSETTALPTSQTLNYIVRGSSIAYFSLQFDWILGYKKMCCS